MWGSPHHHQPAGTEQGVLPKIPILSWSSGSKQRGKRPFRKRCRRLLPFASRWRAGGAQALRKQRLLRIRSGFFSARMTTTPGDVWPRMPGQRPGSLSTDLAAGAAVFLRAPVLWDHAPVCSGHGLTREVRVATPGNGFLFLEENSKRTVFWRSRFSAFLPMPKASLKVELMVWNLLKPNFPCFCISIETFGFKNMMTHF